MVFRRIIAGFFVFLLVIVAIPTFFVYAASRTIFSGNFYKGSIIESTYPYFTQAISYHIYQNDPTIAKYFSPKKIQNEIEKVLTPPIFNSVANQVSDQIEKLKKTPDEPGTINLKTIRESLLTVTHNMAYQLFENIQLCTSNQLPQVNQEGIPTCIPTRGLDYGAISAPISKQFEKTIYSFFPEQIQIDLHADEGQPNGFYYLFSAIDPVKIYLLGLLAAIMAIIALVLYQPVTLLCYEAIAFIISGFSGILLGIAIEAGSPFLLQNIREGLLNNWLKTGTNEKSEALVTFKQGFDHIMNEVVSSLISDIQKIALAFLALGVILLLCHLILKRKPFHG